MDLSCLGTSFHFPVSRISKRYEWDSTGEGRTTGASASTDQAPGAGEDRKVGAGTATPLSAVGFDPQHLVDVLTSLGHEAAYTRLALHLSPAKAVRASPVLQHIIQQGGLPDPEEHPECFPMGFGIEVPFGLFSEYLTAIFREPDVPFRSAALWGMLASDPFMLLRPRDGSQKESHRYTRVCECCN